MEIKRITRRLRKIGVRCYDVRDDKDKDEMTNSMCSLWTSHIDMAIESKHYIIAVMNNSTEDYIPLMFESFHSAYRYFKPYFVKETLF